MEKKKSLTLKRWVSEPSVLPDESSYEFREYKRDLVKALLMIHRQGSKREIYMDEDSISLDSITQELDSDFDLFDMERDDSDDQEPRIRSPLVRQDAVEDGEPFQEETSRQGIQKSENIKAGERKVGSIDHIDELEISGEEDEVSDEGEEEKPNTNVTICEVKSSKVESNEDATSDEIGLLDQNYDERDYLEDRRVATLRVQYAAEVVSESETVECYEADPFSCAPIEPDPDHSPSYLFETYDETCDPEIPVLFVSESLKARSTESSDSEDRKISVIYDEDNPNSPAGLEDPNERKFSPVYPNERNEDGILSTPSPIADDIILPMEKLLLIETISAQKEECDDLSHSDQEPLFSLRSSQADTSPLRSTVRKKSDASDSKTREERKVSWRKLFRKQPQVLDEVGTPKPPRSNNTGVISVAPGNALCENYGEDLNNPISLNKESEEMYEIGRNTLSTVDQPIETASPKGSSSENRSENPVRDDEQNNDHEDEQGNYFAISRQETSREIEQQRSSKSSKSSKEAEEYSPKQTVEEKECAERPTADDQSICQSISPESHEVNSLPEQQSLQSRVQMDASDSTFTTNIALRDKISPQSTSSAKRDDISSTSATQHSIVGSNRASPTSEKDYTESLGTKIGSVRTRERRRRKKKLQMRYKQMEHDSNGQFEKLDELFDQNLKSMQGKQRIDQTISPPVRGHPSKTFINRRRQSQVNTKMAEELNELPNTTGRKVEKPDTRTRKTVRSKKSSVRDLPQESGQSNASQAVITKETKDYKTTTSEKISSDDHKCSNSSAKRGSISQIGYPTDWAQPEVKSTALQITPSPKLDTSVKSKTSKKQCLTPSNPLIDSDQGNSVSMAGQVHGSHDVSSERETSQQDQSSNDARKILSSPDDSDNGEQTEDNPPRTKSFVSKTNVSKTGLSPSQTGGVSAGAGEAFTTIPQVLQPSVDNEGADGVSSGTD